MEPICFYVVIPVYKAEAYIRKCIQSVLDQSYPNFRIVLVDDGSPDRAGTICDEYASKDDRIHVIHQENGGAMRARIAAVKYALACGKPSDYCMFLDSDDTYKPGCLQTVHDTIQETGCDLVIFGMDNVHNDQILVPFQRDKAFLGTVTDRRALYNIVFLDGWYNPLWRKAVSLKLIKDADYSAFYGINLSEDLLQSLQLYRDCRKAVFIPDSLYNYNYNPYSVTNSVGSKPYRVNSAIPARVMAFLESEAIWTAEDFSRYLEWCRKLTRIEIFTILKLLIPLKQKYAILDQLRTDTYYARILDSAPGKDLILTMIRSRHYLLLCLGGSFLKHMGNLRKRLRRRRETA